MLRVPEKSGIRVSVSRRAGIGYPTHLGRVEIDIFPFVLFFFVLVRSRYRVARSAWWWLLPEGGSGQRQLSWSELARGGHRLSVGYAGRRLGYVQGSYRHFGPNGRAVWWP